MAVPLDALNSVGWSLEAFSPAVIPGRPGITHVLFPETDVWLSGRGVGSVLL